MIKIFKTSDVKSGGINNKTIKETDNKKESSKKQDILNVNDDIVDISGKSEIFSMAKKEMDKISELREEKVSILKEKIDKGEYKINEEQVADKIIKENIIDELA